MKRKIGIFALVLVLIMSLFTVTAFAEENFSQLPYSQAETVDDFGTVDEYYEDMFGEASGTMLGAVLCMFICFFLFIPLVVTMIILIVINSKTKKKLSEYKFIYGDISETPYYPQNNYYGYSPVQNAPYQPVQPVQPVTQPNVMPNTSPMGVNPSGSVPQGNENIQQGGQQ